MWTDELAVDGKGRVIASPYNAMLIIANDPVFANCFARNAFTARDIIMKSLPDAVSSLAPQPGPYPRTWTDNDIFLAAGYLNRVYNHRFTVTAVAGAIAAVAAATSFHPVLEWLETLQWDGEPRIDTWLLVAFGADDTEYHRAIGAKFLIAAVRRVRDPGCQFDHVPVLEGVQNLGKSRCCRALFGDRFFSDDMPADFRNKDSPLALLGVWGVELSEIDQLARQDVEVLKAFLSRRIDRFRPPYGRGLIEQPRQAVFIGTTNSDDYLRDSTGNRRIWPVKARKADFGWIANHRDQLWAEAAVREAGGESAWLDNDKIAQEAKKQQAERMYEDVWTETVAEHLARIKLKTDKSTTTRAVLTAIGVPGERQDKRAEMRAATILRCLGWVRCLSRDKTTGDPQKRWTPPHV